MTVGVGAHIGTAWCGRPASRPAPQVGDAPAPARSPGGYHARVHPDELSPVAQDYLKVIWSRTEWGDDPMTTGELADRFGTSAANVTETLKRLDSQGLVERVPYKPVGLTALGAEAAIAMVRRHRLLETYLVRALGYGWHEVHEEAERLEHAVSDEFITRIDAALGHPSADPHGDPIPDADHRWAHPAEARTLDTLEQPGTCRILRVSDADPAQLQQAEQLGLLPDAVLEVRPAVPESGVVDAGVRVRIVRAADGGGGSDVTSTDVAGVDAISISLDLASSVLVLPLS